MTDNAKERPWACFYKQKYDEWHVSVPAGGMNRALFDDGILRGESFETRKEYAEKIANGVNFHERLKSELVAMVKLRCEDCGLNLLPEHWGKPEYCDPCKSTKSARNLLKEIDDAEKGVSN